MHQPWRLVVGSAVLLVLAACAVRADQPTAADAHVITPESVGLHWTGRTAVPSGVGALRLWDVGTTWRLLEPQPPQGGVHRYNWGRLDELLDRVLSAGGEPLVVLGTPPAWASQRPREDSYHGPGGASPPDTEHWRAYVRAVGTHVAQRYDGEVREFQVWNEPNLPGFFSGTPEEMARLVEIASTELRAAVPDAVVVGPGVAGRQTNALSWFEAFSLAGGLSHLDAVAMHLYPRKGQGPLEGVELVRSIRAALVAHGADLPIWDTEVNYGGKADGVFFPDDVGAGLVVQTWIVASSARVARTYWYAWENRVWPGIWTTTEAGAPTAAGQALMLVGERLMGHAFSGCAADGVVATCRWSSPDGTTGTVVWALADTARWPAPPGTSAARLLDGTAAPVESGQLSVTGQPVFVEHP